MSSHMVTLIFKQKVFAELVVTSNSTTYTHTHTHTLGFSTLLKINQLHGELTTVTLRDFHLSNTDKNKNTSLII